MIGGVHTGRAIAALLVVAYHAAGNLAKEKYFGAAAQPLEALFWFGGGAGVSFFFVLSGFIIHHVHRRDLGRPERLGDYLRRRAQRIYPTYLAVFVAVYALAFAVPALRQTLPTDAAVLVKSLLLMPQDPNVVGGTGAPVIVVAWSLQYEIAFYAAYAAGLIDRRLLAALVGAALLGVAGAALAGPPAFPWSFFARHSVLLFLMGVMAAEVIARGVAPRRPQRLAAWAGAFFAAVAVVADLTRAQALQPAFDIAYGAASAVLVVALAAAGPQVARPPPLSRLADASYALYLIHFPLIAVLCKAAAGLPRTPAVAGLAFVAIVAACCAAALAVHGGFERPLLRRLASR